MKRQNCQKTIYIIRHAQTNANRKGKWIGARSVNKLNEYGKKQARFTAKYLSEQNVDASKIFSSPTERALGHAEIIQKRLNIPIEKIHSLTEMNLGILEDRTQSEGFVLAPNEYYNWKNNLRKFEPPLGESAVEASERFYEIVEFISINYTKNDIIIIAHGVVIKLFLARILKASIERGETEIKVPETTHGTITQVNFDGQAFKFIKVIPNKFPDSRRVATFG